MAACLLLCSLATGTCDAAAPIRREGGRLVIETARSTFVFDETRAFALISARDNPTEVEFALPEAAVDLFRLGVSETGDPPGALEWVSANAARDVTCEVKPDRAVLVFEYGERRKITVTCILSIGPDDGFVHGRLAVSGAAGNRLTLERAVFPVLELRAPDGAAVVVGLTKGGVYRDPGGWKRGQNITAAQPGGLAAQFGCLYSARAGLYCAAQDAAGYPKTVQITRTESGLRWTWQQSAFHDLEQPFQLGYDVVFGTFGPERGDRPVDWRAAADLHKAWAMRQPWCRTALRDRTDLPSWLLSGPGMVRFSRRWLAQPDRIAAWLEQYWRRQFGDCPIIVALWGWEHVAPWVSPEYFPPYPSESGFAEAIAAIRKANGHPFPWPSGYHWALDYEKKTGGGFAWDGRNRFAESARPHTVVRRDGKLLIWSPRWLRGGRNAVLCRGDPWTRRWLNRICLELTKRGCDMVQVDQVVGGGMPLGAGCYSTAHGHPPGPGRWDTEAFRRQLDSLAAACRRLTPGMVIGFEEPQELFLDRVGIQDYRDFQKQRWPRLPGFERASVFAYLYHEYVPLFQSNPRAGDRAGMAWGFVTGQVPHIVPHWPVVPASLLRNPDFEDWRGDTPEGWERVRGWGGRDYTGLALRDASVFHSGKASLRLENAETGQIVQISQNIRIASGLLEQGRTYRLRAWFRTGRLERPNRIAFAFLTRDLKSKGSGGIPLVETTQWQQGETEFTVPMGADFLRIMIHLQGPCKVWIDGMGIEERRADGAFRPARTTGLPPGHEFFAAWVRLFHGRGRPYLLLGRALHPPRVTRLTPGGHGTAAGLPAVLTGAFEAADGRVALAVVNTTEQSQRITLQRRSHRLDLELSPWTPTLVELEDRR